MYASGNYVIIGSGNNLCVSAHSYYLYKLVYTVNYTHDKFETKRKDFLSRNHA